MVSGQPRHRRDVRQPGAPVTGRITTRAGRKIDVDDPRLPDRFWNKVSPEPNTGCWLWTAAVDRHGYARFNAIGASRAYRVAFLVLIGPVADGLDLDHLCRTRCCVNPAHLEAVTHAENLRRGEGMVAAFTASAQARRSATHCAQGHEFTEDNTRWRSNGRRGCRACQRERDAGRPDRRGTNA